MEAGVEVDGVRVEVIFTLHFRFGSLFARRFLWDALKLKVSVRVSLEAAGMAV
jgi:hypothetical protein